MVAKRLTPSACPVTGGNPVGLQTLQPSSDVCCQSEEISSEAGIKVLAPSECGVVADIPVGIPLLQPSPDICCQPAGDVTEIVIDGEVNNWINNLESSWTAARDAAVGITHHPATGFVSAINQNVAPDPNIYTITRTFMQFDTSALAGLEILSVAIDIFKRERAPDEDVVLVIVDQGTVTDGFPFDDATDYAKVGSIEYGRRHFSLPADPNDEWYRVDLSLDAVDNINVSGNSIFGAREGHDQDNVEPAEEPDGTAAHRLTWFLDSETPSTPLPSGSRLVVTVTSESPDLAVILTPSACPVTKDNLPGMPQLAPSSQTGSVI
jgi:hypothetical protein